MRRALFLQYTNPAGYPPLQHAISILLDAGWTVHCFGAAPRAGAASLTLPTHPNLLVDMMQRPAPGLLQKAHYLAYTLRCAWLTLTQRPDVVYASDQMAAPAALLALLVRCDNVIYHEHDAPSPSASGSQNIFSRLRNSICRKATWIVVPNAGRASDLAQAAGIGDDRILIVFNCPSRSELSASRLASEQVDRDATVWLYFHGSIVPDRLPVTVIEAMALLPDRVRLRIAGYETAGSLGYTQALKDRARELGIEHRIEAVGAIPDRSALLQFARHSHLGLAFMPMETDDVNMKHMVGASNKPFDYLACGCPLIVSDLQEWRDMFVDAKLASACDPRSAESIAKAVTFWLDDDKRYLEARQAGMRRIESEWNYEMQFAPVLRCIESSRSTQ